MEKLINKFIGYYSVFKNLIEIYIEQLNFKVKKHKAAQNQPITTPFTNYMQSQMPHCDFSLLYKNITSLKITKNNLSKNTYAYYNSKENIIYINKNYNKQVLPHEINHMASTDYVNNNNIFSGFRQNTFGAGLNEGYTEVLTHRYFKKEKPAFSYNFFFRIASSIEIIIGQQEMECLYYKADLKELIKIMNNYTSYSDIKLLIINLDYLYRSYVTYANKVTENKILINKIKEIYIILTKMYIKHLEQEKRFTKKQLQEEIYLFCYALNSKDNKFKKLNIEENINTFEIFHDALLRVL